MATMKHQLVQRRSELLVSLAFSSYSHNSYTGEMPKTQLVEIKLVQEQQVAVQCTIIWEIDFLHVL